MGKLKHGDARRGAKTRAYIAWESMMRRCYNPSQDSYPDYGGRGIGVCLRWHEYANFRADMGACPPEYTLERIDNDGGYTPKNCRWVHRFDQGSNKRSNHLLTHAGKTMTISAWARHLGMKYRTLRARIEDHGWTIAEALSHPVMTPADAQRLGIASRMARRRAQ